MAAKKLEAGNVGVPRFDVPEARDGDVFALSSHTRAREALEFGLSVGAPGFNIFVLGADRSGRMTATLEFLRKAVDGQPRAKDWIYLNNFDEPHHPIPICLPAGEGRRFQARMASLLPRLREALAKAFGRDEYEKLLEAESDAVQGEISEQIETLRHEAREHGLDITQTPQGFSIFPIDAEGRPLPQEALAALSEPQREALEERAKGINEKLRDIRRFAAKQQSKLAENLQGMNREVAENAVGGLLDDLAEGFADQEPLQTWIAALRADILDDITRFRPAEPNAPLGSQAPEQRYAVNLLVDRSSETGPAVVLEPEPGFDTLFGYLEYRQSQGVLETDFSMFRAGALHEANGGILVLRAEALATSPGLWIALKACLRDREIALGNPLRAGVVPIAGVPRPKPIPLDVKVVLVGPPKWYYTFFSVDPEFQTYFRIKADIDVDLEASQDNLAHYAGLIERMARDYGVEGCDRAAICHMIGMSARWAADRRRLTAQFERIEDTVREAAQLLDPPCCGTISDEQVAQAIRARRARNARIEDRLHQQISQGMVMIDVTGKVRGQVNGLVVRDFGDHAFGNPSRVTARAWTGRQGVINVERHVEMAGPIQQKGAMIVQGFLAGRFARRTRLSFNCSITFEQSYGGVEGDSASLAELIAILSELSGLEVRQDLAITGSVNQRGESQAVGGVHHKVEGFFRSCIDKGELTGSQGVVIPVANEPHLVLRDEVVEAIDAGRFHLWSVETIEEALELFLEAPVGEPDADGSYPPDSINGRVVAELERFDRTIRRGNGDPSGAVA